MRADNPSSSINVASDFRKLCVVTSAAPSAPLTCRDAVAAQFGVSTEQLERDHLISHVLAFLSDRVGDQIHFIGGTALARTYLLSGRLSEDIDLIAIDRKSVAATIDSEIPRALARSHGRLTLEPTLSSGASVAPAVLYSPSGLSVRFQLLSANDRVVWPSERRALVQRYTDAPAAQLLVPTLPASAASKTSTWADRQGARDLWDLWALNQLGAIDWRAADLYRRRHLRHRHTVADHGQHGLIPLLGHAQLPHQGSVKDQPKSV
jgi:predicted nucleotidyltransferase component of viral defense system